MINRKCSCFSRHSFWRSIDTFCRIIEIILWCAGMTSGLKKILTCFIRTIWILALKIKWENLCKSVRNSNHLRNHSSLIKVVYWLTEIKVTSLYPKKSSNLICWATGKILSPDTCQACESIPSPKSTTFPTNQKHTQKRWLFWISKLKPYWKSWAFARILNTWKSYKLSVDKWQKMRLSYRTGKRKKKKRPGRREGSIREVNRRYDWSH